MKFRHFISSLFFGSGCALSFIGMLAVILPTLPLPQLQLVLASFSMPSGNAIVSLINSFAAFVLAQSWQTLATGVLLTCTGAWLLVHFAPKPAREPESSVPPVHEDSPSAEEIRAVPAENPFAVERPQERFEEKQTDFSPFAHPKPILDVNRIPETESSKDPDPEVLPYISSRFSDEVQAIETETGLPSQSGSRILIRNSFEPPKETAAPPEPEILPPAPAPAIPIAPSPQPEPVLPEGSSRIRSTMGRHSTAKRNLLIRL